MKIFSRLILCLLCLWLTSSRLLAGPLDKAKEAYTAGDYKTAAKLATKAAKKLKGGDKAQAYALSGAALIKSGKAKKGKSKFKKAFKADPAVELPSEAAGDEKVEKAFAAAQKKSGSSISDGGSGKGSDRLTKTGMKGNKSPSNLKNYLPFGLNSYLQGKTLSAVVFGGAQAGGLLLFLNRKQASAAADKDATAVIADAEANDGLQSEEFLQFLDDNDAFVKKANSEATIALLLAAGGYGLSVIDSLFDPFGTSKTALLENNSKESYANLGSASFDRGLDSSWKFDLQILPQREPGLLLSMKQRF